MNAITFAAPPAWAVMWLTALAVFFACKWLTWAREAARPAGSAMTVAAYFLAWPGMNPAAFLRRTRRRFDHARAAGALGRAIVGAILIWGVVPILPSDRPMLAGWAGMAGMVLVLHFGLLDFLVVAWRARGVDETPLMNAPVRAASLAEFWGSRWNTAFHHLAHRYVFRPLRRPLGPAGAILATFVASGLVHDLVISLPARGGYGLPTLYFLVQGVGVLVERSTVRPPFRRAFAAIVVIAPLPWLFHEPFVTRVILPFLETMR